MFALGGVILRAVNFFCSIYFVSTIFVLDLYSSLNIKGDIAQNLKMHLLGPTTDEGENMFSLFGKLYVDKNNSLSFVVPFSFCLTYEWDPLLDYYIDDPYVGDMLMFRISMQQHPWGVNFLLCTKEVCDA
jgi:hypothetical protein